MLKVCAALDCYLTFNYSESFPRQTHCSRRCYFRHRGQIKRAERKELGLCPQCGGVMDYPPSPHGNKDSPNHCTKCQTYYRLEREKKLQKP